MVRVRKPSSKVLERTISDIMENGDLDTLTVKKIRLLCEQKFKVDLTSRKSEIDRIVMVFVNKRSMPDAKVPETKKAEKIPEAKKAEKVPETKKAERVPETKKSEKVPETKKSEKVPEAKKPEKVPVAKKPEKVPDTKEEEKSDSESEESDEESSDSSESSGSESCSDSECSDSSTDKKNAKKPVNKGKAAPEPKPVARQVARKSASIFPAKNVQPAKRKQPATAAAKKVKNDRPTIAQRSANRTANRPNNAPANRPNNAAANRPNNAANRAVMEDAAYARQLQAEDFNFREATVKKLVWFT